MEVPRSEPEGGDLGQRVDGELALEAQAHELVVLVGDERLLHVGGLFRL